MNIPNYLTVTRIVLIPVIVLVFYWPLPWAGEISAAIFGFAAFTDWLDGYLARKLQQSSHFGAFLDPVADKLMVSTALLLLVENHPSMWIAIASAVIVGREIVISALREWLATVGERKQVSVVMLGKIKTTMQMLAIFIMLFESSRADSAVYEIGFATLCIAVLLTVWSMVVYLKAAWPIFFKLESS